MRAVCSADIVIASSTQSEIFKQIRSNHMEKFNPVIETAPTPKISPLGEEALRSYEAEDAGEANEIMAQMIRKYLGKEAAVSLGLDGEKAEALEQLFYEAALGVTGGFMKAFDERGEYDPDRQPEYWAACDAEGPAAKAALEKAVEKGIIVGVRPEDIADSLNSVTVEDALKLTMKSLEAKGCLGGENKDLIMEDLLEKCQDPKAMRDMFAKVVPADDYYYGRIYREEKIDDESILKFDGKGGGREHGEKEVKVIELGLRLANSTWMAAQRYCAKKDGNTDRIDSEKRGGVFNTPDTRCARQFEAALGAGMTESEAVMRVVFEMCKDSWMLED